jgi:hypothetical protein
MKQLPPLLERWRPWLSLFPDDLAAPLGELLLRLDRQVGPLRSAPARDDALPEGVGSIVQRGPYERMLITEWAYADAEPDEFIRRAASGELMFTGPEPAARRRSRRCVALFDAGPSQLGEPRLLHLALFILLARRAEEAGALFEWGILQNPATLSRESGVRAIQDLLKARTLGAVGEAALQSWAAACDGATDDTWIIGGHGYKAFASVRGQVAIRRSLLEEQLEVSLTLHQSTRTLNLALPDTDLGIRLLRSPFAPLAPRGNMRQPKGRPSLQQAPRFAAFGQWLAVPQLDGGVVAYHVPSSTKSVPGKQRNHPAPASGSILGAGIFGKSFGYLLGEGDILRFQGFPGTQDALRSRCHRPPAEDFRAPPKLARWLSVFFLRRQLPDATVEGNVIALDINGRLGCWSGKSLAFRVISKDVIGAVQFKDELLFACAREDSTDVYSWHPARGSAQRGTIPRTGTRLFFGHGPSWANRLKAGIVALECGGTDWLVGNGGEWETIAITDGAAVLGVASSSKHGVGLVVRTQDKTSIELRTSARRIVLVKSPEAIAQATINPYTGDMAWIGRKTLRVTVQGIDEDKPFLQVTMDESDYAT